LLAQQSAHFAFLITSMLSFSTKGASRSSSSSGGQGVGMMSKTLFEQPPNANEAVESPKSSVYTTASN
jgi:hypothetical protein